MADTDLIMITSYVPVYLRFCLFLIVLAKKKKKVHTIKNVVIWGSHLVMIFILSV